MSTPGPMRPDELGMSRPSARKYRCRRGPSAPDASPASRGVMDAAGLRTVGAVLSCAFVVAADLEPLHRYTSAEYHRLIESGGMPDARVELIDGLLVDMSPKTRAHERALRFLLSWLAARLDLGRYELAVAAPLSLADGTEPEPDLAVIAPGTPAP